mgnify:CR=1 FL=1
MKCNKKGIDKPRKKEKSMTDTRLLGIVKKSKPLMLLENMRTNAFGSVDHETERLTQVALLEAEYRKAEAFALIRRASFI